MKVPFHRRVRMAIGLSALFLLTSNAWTDAEYELGRKIFLHSAQPACALCHTLKEAGSEGAIGPVLDELRPDASRVARVIKDGLGSMPPFKQSLNEAEIKAVSRYVAVATGAQNK